MDLQQYIESINKRFDSGISREHSYRGDLEELIRSLVPGVEITNEPANVTDCGNPDYVITKGEIPIGFIEAKDIGKDLNSKANQEQFERYRKALDNLIITDYIWFQFFQGGELVHEIRIADIVDEKLIAKPENFAEFTGLIQNFCTYIGNTIKSPKKLAGMMAAKARLLQVILEKAIVSDEEAQGNTELQQQYQAFKEILIHDLSPQEFADIYAQTLAYGMFAARLHDDTLDTFSRQEASELIPKSNPFLRKLFNHVAGADIDERIKTTVDNLADVFRATDVKALLKNFGKSTQTQDPIIHFYETFLAEYDPKLRKARGVWYTPEPVVNFIVRGVDEILKTEFGLKDGLADTSKTKIKLQKPTSDGRKKSGYTEVEKEVHKVQVLDPATGTGTFLAEVVKFIYNGKFKSMQGAWSSYVDEHLIPRLNGFELLMASYAMAHLKLDMLLRETGFKASRQQRLNIYLTNSLEEHHPDTGTLFSSWLSTEANEANHIKRDTPVMVVMGNPPYAVSSSNKSDWIQELLVDYKKDLNERNIQPLSDDYIKFIRYGQHFIDKNGEGILAYISNNSFIDGVIHRQMRKNLLESFDKIYIIDLHGNSNKQEVSPDGSKDENVFDIKQGVSINVFIKHSSKINTLAEVYHLDIYGKRKEKYQLLDNHSLASLPFEKLEYRAPEYFFVKKDLVLQKKFEVGFDVSVLFPTHGRGTSFRKDNLLVKNHDSVNSVTAMINDMLTLESSEIELKYHIKQTKDWRIEANKELFLNASIDDVRKVLYRPFDYKYTFYPMDRINKIIPRGDDKRHLMRHLIEDDNFGLVCPKQSLEGLGSLVTKSITDNKSVSAYNPNYIFPLYLYPEENKQQSLGESLERKPNLDPEIVESIAQGLGLQFVPEKEEDRHTREGGYPSIATSEQEVDSRLHGNDETGGTFAPIDLLDYIYAVLHSPTYRETYKEFLKIDFPRIPYPKDTDKFWALVKLGGELRQIHLLESPKVENYITSYPEDGDNIITRKITKTSPGYKPTSDTHGKVWINDTQYFDGVPLIAWEFYIGGYQPAQKWLKDRVGRKLSFDDILHYQKIIVALTETHRIMQEIDKVGV